jgi:hypothetical protein
MIECFELKKPADTLCSQRKTACFKWLRYSVSAVCVIFLAISFSGCGCGKKKKASSDNSVEATEPVSRMEDKGYREVLNKHQDDQKVVARERNELAARMSACAERVKAGLPADITQEDYKAALEKDEEWQSLLKAQSASDQDVRDVLHESQQSIRERMLKEARDAKAATGG